MTKVLKNKWLKALVSGRYKKGRGALIKNERYCCLGVLGKICRFNLKKVGTNEGLLNSETSYKLEITYNQQNQLAVLNDNSETFKEKVIPWIKKHI